MLKKQNEERGMKQEVKARKKKRNEEWFFLMYLLFCFSHDTFLGVVLLVLT